MQGYFDLMNAMALSPVDQLSDVDAHPSETPASESQSQAEPAPKPKPKAKGKGAAKAKSKPKSEPKKNSLKVKSAPKPKAKTKQGSGTSKRPATREEDPTRDAATANDPEESEVMKRPSALRNPKTATPGDRPITVHKGLYKCGKYGFKINGQEKFRVPKFQFMFVNFLLMQTKRGFTKVSQKPGCHLN